PGFRYAPSGLRRPRTIESERLERDDRTGVEDAGNRLHLLIDEMADVGSVLDVEFHQQVEISGDRVDLRGNLGVGELVGHLVGLSQLAFDLDEEGNHDLPRAGAAAV